MFAPSSTHHGLEQPMQGSVCHAHDPHASQLTNQFASNRWQPIKPSKARRRKRSFQMFRESSRAQEAADRAQSAPVFSADSNSNANSERATRCSHVDLEHFMKPSTKRRRTNQMQTAKDQIPVLAQPALERDLFSHRAGKHNENNAAQHSLRASEREAESRHAEAPYLRQHPYHSQAGAHGLGALLHEQHKEKSPEKLMERMNLNGFEIHNRESETVAQWKHSIEAQLNDARNGPSELHELCRRIREAQGLGRAVLVAKLRQKVGDEAFDGVAQRMGLQLD